ncbi:FAD-dependent oxidoreductase [Micromonospora echinaurantiaca]|uniref:FAD-dependent oxidoreductase n=1 Tax=Micromonospora echinaurantiaca TaxID=47857 RepID=UPI003798E2A9
MTRVAVIGAGPSGVFATAELLTRPDVEVDVVDRLPTPFGLVRYGVAPDHLKIKSMTTALTRILADPRVRFYGNVEYGTDLTLDDLKRTSDAVVLATGAPLARRLGIPGEDLPGNWTAADLVSWYNGHPVDGVPWTGDATAVAVVGAGNVALDIARVLLKGGVGLGGTDIPEPVAAALDARPVTDVHLVIRRGVADVKFSPAELLELDKLDLDILVDPTDVVLDDSDRARASEDRVIGQRVDVFHRWSQRAATAAPRRLHVHFRRSPTEILGEGRVAAIRLRDNASEATEDLPVSAVVAAVGYRTCSLPGVSADPAGATVHTTGRVEPGLYVAGWLKRGPSGVIGTNKQCAIESVRSLWADLDAGLVPSTTHPGRLSALIAARRCDAVDWAGWKRIEAAEIALGASSGRARTKITDLASLVRIGAGVEHACHLEDVR